MIKTKNPNIINPTDSYTGFLEEEPEEVKMLKDIIDQYNKLGCVEGEIPEVVDSAFIPLNPFPRNEVMDGYHSTI